MDKYKLKFTRLQQEILRLLCVRAGSGLSQREIARLLNVSPTAVGKAIPLLIDSDLITSSNALAMNVHVISLARTMKAMTYKKIINLSQVYEFGFDSFLEEQFPGTTIVLFGSFAKGEDVVSSDIDIAIIGGKEKSVSLEPFENLFERTINLQWYDSLQAIHNHLKENICNGIVLAGSMKL